MLKKGQEKGFKLSQMWKHDNSKTRKYCLSSSFN